MKRIKCWKCVRSPWPGMIAFGSYCPECGGMGTVAVPDAQDPSERKTLEMPAITMRELVEGEG